MINKLQDTVDLVRSNTNTKIVLIAVTFVGSVFGKGFKFGTNFVIGATLGPAALGVFNLGMVLLQAGNILSGVGLHKSSQRIIPNAQGWNRKQYNGVILTIIATPVIVGTVSALLGIAIVNSLDLGGYNKYQRHFELFILTIPFFTLVNVASFATRAFDETKYFVYAHNFVLSGLSFVLILIIAPMFNSLYFSILSYLLCAVIAAILSVLFLKRLSGLNIKSDYKFQTKRIFKISIPLMTIAGSNYLLTWTDTVLISYFATAETVGKYQAAYLYAALTPFVVQALNSVFIPRSAKLYSKGNSSELEELYTETTLWGGAATIGLCAWFIIHSGEFLSLYGSSFNTAKLSLFILCIGYALSSLSGPVSHLLSMSNYEKIEAYNTIFMGTLNVGLNILFIPKFGMAGAAIATSISLVLMNAVRLVEVHRFLGMVPYDSKYLSMCYCLGLSIVSILLLDIYFSGVASIVISAVVAGILFVILSIYFDLISSDNILLSP